MTKLQGTCRGLARKSDEALLELKNNRNSRWSVRYIGNFRLIPEIINKFMTVMSDPVRAKHVQVFKLKLK
jgi:hypothetical protein